MDSGERRRKKAVPLVTFTFKLKTTVPLNGVANRYLMDSDSD